MIHNPHNVLYKELPPGYRFLDQDEICEGRPVELKIWSETHANWISIFAHVSNPHSTYRTKYSREELTRLRNPYAFTCFRIGDVNTAHITASDAKLMGSNPRYRLACIDPVEDSPGTIFIVAGTEVLEEQLKGMREEGFSPDFCNLFREASRQGIEYLRFDSIAEPVKKAPTHNW